MDLYKPINEMTKKEKRRYYASKRGSWGNIKPVTKVRQNKKAYNRKRDKNFMKRNED